MKKIIVISLLSSFILADNLTILNTDKKQLREIEKNILQENHKNLKNEWISPININSSLNTDHSFSNESDHFNKSISLGFSQNIYESGGIKFSIRYADEKLRSDFLAWEKENNQLFQTIYELVLQIKKLTIELQQNEYELKNKEIELILKRIQYENGKSDITELNDALMAKNNQLQQNINLQNSIKEQKLELEKYTNLKFEQIELLDFSGVDKEQYLANNIELLYENSLVALANTSYEKLKTNYLPKISVSTNLSYSNNENLTNDTIEDSTSGSVSLNFSMPLYDINKQPIIEKSKLELLKQKIARNNIKHELKKEFDETLTNIDTYKQYNKIINNNIDLYNDLIEVNKVSSQAGMSSQYDLEILQNTKKINQYNLTINDINIQLEYSKLYFKIKADK